MRIGTTRLPQRLGGAHGRSGGWVAEGQLWGAILACLGGGAEEPFTTEASSCVKGS